MSPADRSGIYAVIPPVQQVVLSPGEVFDAPARVLIAQEDHAPALRADAELLAGELAALAGGPGGAGGPDPVPVAVGGARRPGDVVLVLGEVEGASSPQGYRIEASSSAVLTGPTPEGVFHASRTLLAALGAGGMQAGTVVDEPAKAVRGLHVDAARKYAPLPWLIERVRQMSALKLNELQLHVSENEGFRVELLSHPEVVSAEHLSRQDVRTLVEEARRYHVRVVPALDVPGHMRQVLAAHPDLRAGRAPGGPDLLDYSRPEARALVTELLDELVPLFGARTWHLGGDEVFPMGEGAWDPGLHDRLAADFPRLADYARRHVGEQATVLDGYVHYLGTVAEHLRSLGVRQVRAWNDALGIPGTTQRLDAEVVITYWTSWHEAFAPVQYFVDAGHRVINFNDSVFYYVLTEPGRAYWDKPSAQAAWAWRPGVFPARHGGEPQVWDDGEEWNMGAMASVWCDVPEAESLEQVAAGITPLLEALAARTWGCGPSSRNPGPQGGEPPRQPAVV